MKYFVILTEFGYKIYQPENRIQLNECVIKSHFNSNSLEECERWIEESNISLDEMLWNEQFAQ